MKPSNLSRRDILKLGFPALAGAALTPAFAKETDIKPDAAKAATPTPTELRARLPFPERWKQIERAWLDLLGEFPTEILPLGAVVKKDAYEEGITRYHVSFQTQANDRVTAYLLVPDSAKGKKVPAIIVLHSTTFGSGKKSVVGLSGRRPQDPPTDPAVGRASALELTRHGFITLSIDLLTDGERVAPGARIMDTRGFYKQFPEWSIIGKNCWDISRSVDFLQTLDYVDGSQIGCIGWSLGGHQSIFAAAFDQRITATVSNGGVIDWHRHSEAWSRKPPTWEPWKEGDPIGNSPEIQRRFGFKEPTNSGPYIYIKKFRPYIDDQSLPLPVDFDELMMLVAPRPLLLISSEWEFKSHRTLPKCLETIKVYMEWKDIPGQPSVLKARQERLGYDKTQAYYEFNYRIDEKQLQSDLLQLGAGDCFSWFSFPGGHAFPDAARRFTFAWFDRWLGFAPPPNAPLA